VIVLDILNQRLKENFAQDQFHIEAGDCWVYGYDNSRRHALPNAVIFAQSHDDIVKTVQLCSELNLPLVARGRGSGTTGAAVPIHGGVVLSCERMTKIIEYSPENRYIVVEAGTLNGSVQELVAPQGFFWAPDPTSAPYCTVGGNIACNAAGPRSLKYGATRDNVLGLTAVTGRAETLQCGSYTTKSAAGYDLTRLIIGSEGTLAIVSQAILKLLPKPQKKLTIQIFYRDIETAGQAITNIMSLPITPFGCEFIDANALKMIREHSHPELPKDAQAMLIIEVDGNEESVDFDAQLIKESAALPHLQAFTIAKTVEETNRIWKIRKSLSQALRSLSPHKINEDVVVPVAYIPELLNYTEQLSKQFDIPIVNFGHAGNGNIHVNLLVDPLSPEKGDDAQQALELLFDKVLQLKGCLSGEHGIGIEKSRYLSKQLDANTLKLMQQIKSQFDPQGILNPGKLFEARI